ncbi:phosphotransferase [Rummeliibacillus sp. JY-2-4R]
MSHLKKLIEIFRLNVLSIEDVPESYSSTVYKIQLVTHQTVYLKIPYTKAKLELEYTVLERLKDELPVPRVLNYWEGNEDISGALLLSAIDGVSITRPVNQKLAYDIGRHHAKFHAVQLTEQDLKSHIRNIHEGWPKFVREQFYSFSVGVEKVIEQKLFELALNYFEDNYPLLPTPDGPSFVHMDFRPANILIRKNRVVGIIDFESVRIGVTQIDFTKINRDILCKDETLMDAYQLGYTSIRPLTDLAQVLPFFQFTDAFNSIGWSEKRGLERHKLFYQENLERLKLILSKSVRNS